MNKAHAAFDADYDFRRTETVGPRVSGELVQSGTLGVVLSVVAVLLVITPVGSTVNGSRSWIALPGGFSIQPSELAKVG